MKNFYFFQLILNKFKTHTLINNERRVILEGVHLNSIKSNIINVNFEELFYTNKDPLYKLCYNLCKNTPDCDDLFQETWLKTYRNLSSFKPDSNFRSWLFSICYNTYKDRYRKDKRWINIINDFLSSEDKEWMMNNIWDGDITPEERVCLNDEKAILKEHLSNLKDKYRVPLIMFYFNNLQYKEISQILNIPVGTVKSRINKGKKMLKEKMEGCE